MENEKLLSIIVPVYNKELFLEACIESIQKLNIDKEKIEAIFVDDRSTDKSLEITEAFAEKYSFIKSIQLEENSGSPSTPRNVGIKEAKGTYVTFLDADDWLDAEGLPMLVNQAAEHRADVAFGQSVKHTEKIQKKLGRFSSYKVANNLVPYEIERIFRAVGPPGKIIKRAIIIDNEIEFKHMKYGEDKLFFIDAISKCKTASMNSVPVYHVNRYTYNQSLVGQTSILEKTRLNLKILEEILKLNLPAYAEFQAISRIIEVDFMARLFNNNRFLNAENKASFYDLFHQMTQEIKRYGKNVEDYLLENKFRNIYQFLKNEEYQKLNDFITILIQAGKAKKYVKDNQVYFLMPKHLQEALPVKEPIFAVYEGTQWIDQNLKEAIRVYKDNDKQVNKVLLSEINNELNYKSLNFIEKENYIYINTEDLEQCDYNFNLGIIYDDYKFITVNMNLPNANDTVNLRRQNFKTEFEGTGGANENPDATNKYLSENVKTVIVIKKAHQYLDVEFNQLTEEDIEVGELIEIKEIVRTHKGTPRLKTANGYFITANKQFVNRIVKATSDKYIYDLPQSVTILKKCKEYQNRKFEGEAINILNNGDQIEIKKIVLSPKGTPRLKTLNNTFITANRDFVKEV
ncbi:DUF5776 domain-containing protein [Staphylococcus caeli]|uniref:Glycosyltransferase n=1 Tax=Staphylococcus caeli TaxID=2201815 RepID=A0A1D4P1M6_9STAP|nr:DUF5776 domain-containing protein [Staphylococcus caeli]SCS98452.1 glycosyltransferase [Staphylococcus caeli]SCT16826.1 glycosyltransferase [Staphylococcus caeli]